MKHSLIILMALILQAGPAYADRTCSPEMAGAALSEIKSLNRQLLRIPPSATTEGDIAPEAKLPMGLLNEAFKHWMTAELNCQPSGTFNLAKFNAHIQETIKLILAEKPAPKDDETHYGLNWVKFQFDQQQQFLFVKMSQGIPCTDDMALLGYSINKDQQDAWTKVIDISSDYSLEKPGSYRFKKPSIMKDPQNGHTVILLTSIPGQCNSMWYGFDFRVIEPDPNGHSHEIFATGGMYFNGELTDDGGPELKTHGNRFRLSWHTPDFADHDPGEAVQPETTIKTYELNNGVVKAAGKGNRSF
ncbi:MAG: hypothetical protein JWO78_2485 [Micavibrio sp.]|nr:hypothetical protein [Micavibrio sp.]